MPPRNKDPNKPKGRTSAYAFFVQDRREMHKEKGEKVEFAKFSKECSELWKDMTDEEKSKYARQAKEDKDRYTHEMGNYQPPSDEEGAPAKGGKKKKKDKNQPKRAMSAFLLFCGDKRPKLREKNPTASVGDLAKLLGAEWKTLNAAQKAPYDEKAKKEKDRYKAQMEAYKKPKPARKSKHEEDEEEEEEEEEEAEEEEEEDADDDDEY